LSVNVVIVDSKDRGLDELLLAAGMRAKHIGSADLDRLASPSAAQPDVVIVDRRGPGALPDGLSAMKRQHPTTGVVIVATTLDPALMLEAMRAGVNEWVSEPITREDLEEAIRRVLGHRVAPVTGEVFAFVGAKGGIGTTTVAVNVAASLGRLGATLLIDLHVGYGDAAMFFGVEPRFSIADVLENTHRLDESYLHSVVVRTKAGLDILASSDRSTGPVDARRIRAVIEFAARHYRYLVLDCPRSDPAVLDSLQQANAIVIVANQELGAVRNASRIAMTLRQRYGAQRVSTVVSRFDAISEIRQEDVAKVVGGSIKAVLPSAYRQSLEALNKARPLVLDNHNKLAGSLIDLAHELASTERSKVSVEKTAGLFGRLTGRR